MKLSIRLKMGIAIVMVAIMPIILGVALLEGSLFSYLEQVLDEEDMMPSYDRAMQKHSQFIDLVKEQIRTGEETLDYEDLYKIDSSKEETLLGFYVQVDGKEMYRSPWMQALDLDMTEYEDLGWLESVSAEVMNITEVVTLDHSYKVYTMFNLKKVNDAVSQYAGFVLLGVVSVFALVTFLLILWVFRHVRISMKELMAMTENILSGDLKKPVPYSQKDEFRDLADMINTLRSDLHDSNVEKEHLEKERERMLANIAHDIKTPITAIKGCAQMLSDGLITGADKEKEYFDIILSRSHVIEHMVNDLKEVIKYDVGSITLNFADVNLGYFIDDCIDDFRINHKDQSFQIDFEKTYENLMLRIDPNLIQRVFKNIIGNALKYNRDRDVNIQIDTDKVGNTIRFKISDDGIGVADEALDKLFDRLYRADSSRTSKIEGSGIGLSICKEIIEAHRGKIWAENSAGRFSVLFSIPITGVAQ